MVSLQSLCFVPILRVSPILSVPCSILLPLASAPLHFLPPLQHTRTHTRAARTLSCATFRLVARSSTGRWAASTRSPSRSARTKCCWPQYRCVRANLFCIRLCVSGSVCIPLSTPFTLDFVRACASTRRHSHIRTCSPSSSPSVPAPPVWRLPFVPLYTTTPCDSRHPLGTRCNCNQCGPNPVVRCPIMQTRVPGVISYDSYIIIRCLHRVPLEVQALLDSPTRNIHRLVFPRNPRQAMSGPAMKVKVNPFLEKLLKEKLVPTPDGATPSSLSAPASSPDRSAGVEPPLAGSPAPPPPHKDTASQPKEVQQAKDAEKPTAEVEALPSKVSGGPDASSPLTGAREATPVAKKRGRPAKAKVTAPISEPSPEASAGDAVVATTPDAPKAKGKPGRKSKSAKTPESSPVDGPAAAPEGVFRTVRPVSRHVDRLTQTRSISPFSAILGFSSSSLSRF